MERTKIAGAVLFALLLPTTAKVVGNHLVHPAMPAEDAYPIVVEDDSASASEAGDIAAAEPVISLAAALAAGDAGAGAKVAKKCAACHSFDKGGAAKVGPPLWGIVGASVAGYGGFSYSKAFKELGGVWNYEELNAFLLNPKAYAPGTKMLFKGVGKPGQRADLILYLRGLHDAPPPLPAQGG